ncbi:2-C-methyl-D-erythritol 4-phosphate cytidylyltransferase [Kangiella shandongensis]|uniref:2-C-methyl-D-erythritol 4-phosphate cytidylyltransferase n=1 Tax=Kangiella shandongensis TaxID=2763258 RepID=UPI001CC10EF0|nr:2-C-methyl-D-erythritol 4-phosphate cytidylyltransferase [Kangiella shandongensis]
MSSERIWAVIPAAGIGSRMNSDTPKQYLKIAEKTILEHSINCFLEHSKIYKVVVALHPEDTYWEELPFKNNPRVITTTGGKERVDSVLAGLKVIQETESSQHDWVMVHDAARPCLKAEQIDDLIHAKDSSPEGAILAIGVTDTVKLANKKQTIEKTIDRDTIWLAQTPQFFPVDSLKRSIESALEKGEWVTDEASAMELSGHHPSLVIGSRKNIKITEQEDLFLASLWLSRH